MISREVGSPVLSSEARIAIESALAVAEIVSQTEIVQSTSFNQLITYLHDAVEALARAEGEPAASRHTIFPSTDAANEHLAGIEPAADVAYRLSRSGDGKCVVQVFKSTGFL